MENKACVLILFTDNSKPLFFWTENRGTALTELTALGIDFVPDSVEGTQEKMRKPEQGIRLASIVTR